MTLLQFASCRRGWQIVEEFTDQGVSGCKESRPALSRLMSDPYRRRFDALLVWKIIRFGRSLKHLVNALAELAALGVAFVSLRDNLDLSTPSGRLMFQIMARWLSSRGAFFARALRMPARTRSWIKIMRHSWQKRQHVLQFLATLTNSAGRSVGAFATFFRRTRVCIGRFCCSYTSRDER